jgi:hypothetical protein
MSQDDLLKLLADSPAHANFNIAGEGGGPQSLVLGVMKLEAGGPAGGASDDDLYSVSAHYNFPTTLLGDPDDRQDLIIGLLNPSLSGSDLRSLHFVVTYNGDIKIDQLFTNPADVADWFANNSLDLGSLKDIALIDLGFELDVQVAPLAAPAPAGLAAPAFATPDFGGFLFSGGMVFGNATPGAGASTPEPFALAPLAALSLLVRRRRIATVPQGGPSADVGRT